MKIIDEINKKAALLRRMGEAKNALDTLTINWETDINKMDFSKLRSYKGLESCFSRELLRIENVDISNEMAPDYVLGNQSFIEMLDILINGGKLIPPAYVERYAIIDGKEQKTSSVAGGFDGMHRVMLARHFGLDTIPVCVFKEYDGHWFTPTKWTFESGRIREETAIIHTEYDVVKVVSKETGDALIFREYGLNVNNSNRDYIIIIVAPEDRPF